MDFDSKTIIENGIGTIGKIKIIKALAEENKLVTIYVLHKRTGLKKRGHQTKSQRFIKY
jgi:hypothetical protein